MFDLHLLSILANGFKFYVNNKPAFKKLFLGISDSTLEQWYSLVTLQLPLFSSRYAQGTREAPMITVIGGIESVSNNFLGKALARNAQGFLEVGYQASEDAQVVILAKSPELARCYAIMIRAAFEQSLNALLKAGYDQAMYTGGQALDPEEELASEELGIYVKKLNFSSMYTVKIELTKESEFGDTTVISNPQELLVLAVDQEKDGIKGGVIPQT